MAGILYRDAAVTDARSDRLTLGMSLLVTEGILAWMGPTGDEPDPGGARIVDAGGATVVPSMVDSHSHLTLPGGSHWIDRGLDPAEELTRVAEENARLMLQSGVRWCRDVGSPPRPDPEGGQRALAVQLRHRWHGRGR
jgi:imidazolonepropionase-like amidohydrolase